VSKDYINRLTDKADLGGSSITELQVSSPDESPKQHTGAVYFSSLGVLRRRRTHQPLPFGQIAAKPEFAGGLPA